MSQSPTIGRIVHFTATEGDAGPYPGIIVRVCETPGNAYDSGTVDLVTFGPNSVYHNHAVPYSVHPKPGSWNWPRVEA